MPLSFHAPPFVRTFTTMRLIDDWLFSKNFFTGRALYKVLGKNDKLKALFKQGNTCFAAGVLLKSLTELNTAPVMVLTSEDLSLSEMPEEDDEVLTGINYAWKEQYARMNMLRHKIWEYGADNSPETIAACAPLCKEVLELEKAVNKLWETRDYYKQHGKLPEVETKKIALSEKVGTSAVQIENIKKNIRRNKGLVQKFPGNATYAQKLRDYQELYKEVTGEDYKERVK